MIYLEKPTEGPDGTLVRELRVDAAAIDEYEAYQERLREAHRRHSAAREAGLSLLRLKEPTKA